MISMIVFITKTNLARMNNFCKKGKTILTTSILSDQTILYSFRCSSHLGRKGGVQTINVGQGCSYKGSVLHQIMHTLGFLHEHTRPDRKCNNSLSKKYGIIKLLPYIGKYTLLRIVLNTEDLIVSD